MIDVTFNINRKTLLSRSLAVSLALVALLLITACGPAEQSPESGPGSAASPEVGPDTSDEGSLNNEGYPAPDRLTNAEQAYPVPPPTIEPNSAYPAEESGSSGILFALDKPISVTNTSVGGVGPPGLVVYIVNITFMGELLGTGVIQEDGTFSIPIEPLEPGIQIGLTGDVSAIALKQEDIQPGNLDINIPQVGYFYDTFVIGEN